jgi:hypothetical protein
LLLPKLTDEVRDQLQDVGFLGGYALLPALNELCFKTQVAVRAMLLTCNEWEYFIGNGEDLADDHSAAVVDFVRPLLEQYRADAVTKLRSVAVFDRTDANANELALLKMRWEQVKSGIDAFLGN